MNYLAHLFLSPDNHDELLGNLMGDFVKGAAIESCSVLVQKGIRTHRQIDKYTDSHPVFLRSRKRLDKKVYRFSGILIDIFYDHFLAVHWGDYSDVKFETQLDLWIHKLNREFSCPLPDRLPGTLEAIIHGGMLHSYRSQHGIEYAVQRLASRLRFANNLADGMQDFYRHYELLEADFAEFFPQLINFAKELTVAQW